MEYCKICGAYNCQTHKIILGKTINIREFSGSSPPEIFVGKWNYPNVYTGILSPTETGETKILSSHEIWHEKKIQIPEILSFRNQLIYGRTTSNIRKPSSKFLDVFKEIAMSHDSVSTECVIFTKFDCGIDVFGKRDCFSAQIVIGILLVFSVVIL